MKIEKNKVVVLTYQLSVDGEIVDRATAAQPLDYIQGMHMLLPKFEEAVEGLEEGATFSFTLTPEDGYGAYEKKRCFDVPKSAFEIDGVIREDLMVVGRMLPMIGSAGQVVQAKVVEVKEEAVTLDFNHPMAGKTLDFTGSVLSVREATEKELMEGLHGEFLPPEAGHCGCHGGCKGHCHEEGEACDCGQEGCDCGEEGHECHHGGEEGHCCGKGKGEGRCHHKE